MGGCAEIAPGALLGVASAPLLRVPLDEAASFACPGHLPASTPPRLDAVHGSSPPSKPIGGTTAPVPDPPPPAPPKAPTSDLLDRFPADQRERCFRLWTRLPAHIKDLCFNLHEPGWPSTAWPKPFANLLMFSRPHQPTLGLARILFSLSLWFPRARNQWRPAAIVSTRWCRKRWVSC